MVGIAPADLTMKDANALHGDSSVRFLAPAVLLLLAACSAISPGSIDTKQGAENLVSSWLDAVTKDTEDRGFRYLHPAIQTKLDRSTYQSGLASVASEPFSWKMTNLTTLDGSDNTDFYSVAVEVEGGSAKVPPALLSDRLAAPYVRDGEDVGIFVIVRVGDGMGGIWDPLYDPDAGSSP